jgi:hypothetical protein
LSVGGGVNGGSTKLEGVACSVRRIFGIDIARSCAASGKLHEVVVVVARTDSDRGYIPVNALVDLATVPRNRTANDIMVAKEVRPTQGAGFGNYEAKNLLLWARCFSA